MSLADMGTATRGNADRGGADIGAGIPGGRMTHSLSTPSGVDGTPSTPRHRGGKKLTVRIQMLDDSVTMFQVQAKALGKVLFEQVCRQLNLLEADYFGLEYQEISTHTKYWLDLEKPLNRQVGLSLIDPVLRFCIKFYTPDPSQLEEEYTRYLFCLQIKRDLATGSLQCNDNTAALMASYIVQASCGDYVPEDYPDHTYLSSYRFVPHQDAAMQRKIMENHKKHVGQSPAEADLNLLETARRCELYGMKMHPAKDVEGVPLNLAVAHMGIAVFQNLTRINTFSWAKIRKISFKRKRFLVKLHPEGYGYYKDTVEFFFEGRNECKNFWKKCVENHGFFRCAAVHNQPRRKTRVLSRGSSFRYSGKTQKQIIEFVRENYVKRQNFQRSQSFRQGPLNASSRSQSHTYVNSSISANPLLPIDTAAWDYRRNQCTDSMTPSLTKKAADTLDRRQDNPTDHMRSQVTAAQVEIYQTKNYAPESPTSEGEQAHHSAAGMDQMNSNRSVSPPGPQSWTSPSSHHLSQPHSSMRAQDQGRAHPGDHNIGLSHLSHLYSNNTPRRVSVASQAYVPVSPQPHMRSTNTSNINSSIITTNTVGLSVDLSSSMELEQEEDLGEEEEEELVEEEADSDLTASTTNRENMVLAVPTAVRHQQLRSQESRSQTATPVHYSSTSYSMSKQCLLNNNNSTETETDNIIYTDINDIGHYKYPEFHTPKMEHKISNSENLNLNERNDIYATVNRKAKSKSREKHFSDEFIDETILQYTRAKQMHQHQHQQQQHYNGHSDQERSTYSSLNYQYHNDLNHPSDSSSSYFGTGFGTKRYATATERVKLAHSENYLIPSLDSQSSASGAAAPPSCGMPRHTHSLPRNSELSGVDSVDSYDSHYLTHHSIGNLQGAASNIPHNYVLYHDNKPTSSAEERSATGSPMDRFKTSSEKLEYEISSTNLYSATTYNKEAYEEENIYDQVERESWLKSSSCKDLYDFSAFYESEKSKPMTAFDREFLSFNRIDSPVTRYDDSRHSMYITKNHSIDANHGFSPLTNSKVFSSSYPGSTYNTQDHQYRRGYGHHVDYTGSQDDISQDSYELLEKYDIDFFSGRRRSEDHMRSCSLDSGNYIPSDDESASEQHKYRSAMDVKSKSAVDIMNEIWDSEDPRYLPREKLSVKSDGSFYKKVKEALSRTSSQESHSEVYETKISRSSDSSKKSRDSLYHTDSKKSRETTKSKTSVASSQDSKESLVGDYLGRNYEMPTTTGKKLKQLNKKEQYEKIPQSSQESKSDYYDAVEGVETELSGRPKVKSHDCLLSDTHSSTANSSFYDSRDTYSTFPSKKSHKTSKVHSISLQNVEIERNAKSFGTKSPDSVSTPASGKKREDKDLESERRACIKKSDSQSCKISAFRRRSDSENIFSFDQDRIECIQNYTKKIETQGKDEKPKHSPEYPLTPELISEFEKQQTRSCSQRITRKEELMAKTHFEEYNPIMVPLSYSHATVERTKSDPNSLANRVRLGSNSRRHVLMHQKSIDLTPADSSDEDYIYKQIPSAPPLCKAHGNFEMPKCYDVPVVPMDIPKTGFELPKSFFRDYERRFPKIPKEDIPYVLHKRHVMNGTAPSPGEKKHTKPKSPKSPKSPRSPRSPKSPKNDVAAKAAAANKAAAADFLPDILDSLLPAETKEFLFTQNIDLSKVNPITLEVNKSLPTIELSSPKRDITKQMDPSLLEKLNKKLSQIESDSATSSRTESLQQQKHKLEQKQIELIQSLRKELQVTSRKAAKTRIIPKTKVSNKPKKSKTRITSFSSDDESLDSDDVFGSAEAIPDRLEFSPPQSRKEIEPILRIEQSRLISAAWGRGQTMSSTEIEGSPPQCRRLADLESRYHTQKLDPQYANATELRRISERSISIPSSEDEPHVPIRRMDECTNDYQRNENIPSPILEHAEFFRSNDDIYETCHEEKITGVDIDYTLKKKAVTATAKSKVKLIEEAIDSSIVMRSKGHAPILFAHARLNLSEGSVSLQRQRATLESPNTERRTKSLDTPVISLHRLPPMNAFSSKDDTVGFEEEAEILEEKSIERQKQAQQEDDTADSIHSCAGSIPTQPSYATAGKDSFLSAVTIEADEVELLNQLKFIEKIALQGVKIKDKKKTKTKLKSGDNLILDIPRYRFTDWSPYSSANSSRRTSPGVSRASSVESTGKGKLKTSPKSSEAHALKKGVSRSRPESRRTSAEDIKTKDSKGKKSSPKERPRSIETRRPSRDKKEESEADIAKRKERQQKLYESAMKQTITMLSPVKDTLPPFPAPEDKISVKTDGDNIIIETEFKSKAEDHVLIAKSPRKLDTSLVKFSRSFDDGRSPDKLDKANRSFEDRNKSFEESEKSDAPDDMVIKSPKKIAKSLELKQKIEGSVVHKKIDGKSNSLEKPAEHHYLGTDVKARSLDEKKPAQPEAKKAEEKPAVRSAIGDRRMFAHQYNVQEDIDMQAVISERRSLEILKRSLPSEDTKDSDGTYSRKPSTADSLDSFVSVDESHSPASKSPIPPPEGYTHRVPTIECEEPSIEEDDNSAEGRHLKVSRLDTTRLSLDRSKSEETGSWMTVECDEFVGSDTSDNEPRTLEPDRNVLETQATLEDANPLEYSNCVTPTSDLNILVTPPNTSPMVEKSILETFEKMEAQRRKRSLEKQSDKSKSSDSWTSGEKDVSPQRQEWSSNLSVGKEKSSMDEESSVSCSIARPLGISQDFGDIEEKKCLELKQKMLKLDVSKAGECTSPTSPSDSNDTTPTNATVNEPKIIIKKPTTPTLEKQSPIDLGTSQESYLDPIEEKIAKLLQRNEDSESSSGGSRKPPKIEKPARANVGKKLAVTKLLDGTEKPSKSSSDRSSQESKSSFDSKGSLSVESRGSFETESSSGSLGAAQRRGELSQKVDQSTWKPFPIESSNSSSTDDPWHHVETDGGYERYDGNNPLRDSSDSEFKEVSPDEQKESDTSFQDDLNDFPATFGYPAMTSALSGIGVNPTDIIGYSTGFTLGRTLSRISERSTASEKSSMEDDVSKASTHSVSMRDESVASTDHQPSLSSDSRSNTNLAYISDADRRTSAEMPDIPCDSATGDRLSSIGSFNEPKSPTVVTGRFSVTQVAEQQDDGDRPTLMCLSNAGSQDSEDWPLPEIPFDHVPVKPLESIYAIPDLDKPVPKTFCWKASMSFQSQDSQEWPSPPSSTIEGAIVVENIETYYATEAQSADQIMVESFTTTEHTETEDEASTQIEDKTRADAAKVLPYEDTAYLMSAAFEDKDFGSEELPLEPTSCLSSTLSAATCLSTSFNVTCTSSPKAKQRISIRKDSSSESVIVSQPTRSPAPRSPISEDELFSSDDVFMPGTIKVQLSSDESRTTEYLRKLSRGSNNSDTSIDDILSGSGGTYMDDQTTVRRNYEARLSTGSCKKCSHSSHSEEETSSIGTELDGTVRMGLQQKKCTHSSHSEDTSIGLSISEWSTGTNTVRQYANLSGSDSLSAVSTHSCPKSEKSNQTKSSMSSINKSAESLNEQSGSFSNKFSGDNGSSDGLRYDILSNSETDKMSETTSATKSDDTTLTLTEMAHTITEWSTSSSRTLVGVAPTDSQAGGVDRGGNRRSSYIDYQPLKQTRVLAKKSPSEEKRSSLPQIHRRSGSNGNSSRIHSDDLSPTKTGDYSRRLPSLEDKDNVPESSAAARKRRSLEMMSKLYQSQDISSESEAPFIERLYAPSEKLTERYQSQEFVPLHAGQATPQQPQPAPKPQVAQKPQRAQITQKPKAPQPPTKPKAPQPPTKPKPSVTRPVMQALLKHMQAIGKADEEGATEPPAEQPAAPPKVVPPPVPTVPPVTSPSDIPQTVGQPPEKPLAKHHSYDDKTLSKSQIREYKTQKLRQSSSFHEHMLSKSQQSSQESMPPRIDEELSLGGGASGTSSATTTATDPTSTETSSPQMPQRAERLNKCSPYYSSSLSSESPPNQLIQKPPRKGSIARTSMIKSPPSGNDTDSSMDIRMQDPKLRSRGYRKKRQVTAKRIRSTDRTLVEQESSECSEGYLPEIDSGSSDPSYRNDDQYYEFDEELEHEQETDEYDDYPHYGGSPYSSSNKFESLDMTDNVDEMGFPRYDRLSHITNPMYQQQQQQQSSQSSASSSARTSYASKPAPANHPMPPPTGQPVKPVRTKKRQLKREDSIATGAGGSQYHGRAYCNPEESEVETKAGLSDDPVTNSSEDSSGFMGATGTIRRSSATARQQYAADLELPYPDFLSDYENEPIEYERYACGLDIRVDPPPKFNDSDDLSDQ